MVKWKMETSSSSIAYYLFLQGNSFVSSAKRAFSSLPTRYDLILDKSSNKSA